MNILNKFIIRNLRLNKKRTIVTIIGIMLSSALICGVIGLVSSTQESLIKMAGDNNGYFDTRFYNVSKENLKYIQNNVNVKDIFITSEIGTAKLEGSKNKYKPYISILGYDEKALKDNAIHLIEGRLPENEHEVVIAEHIKSNGRVTYNIGDTITLDVGHRQLDDGTFVNNMDEYYEKDEDNSYTQNEKLVNTIPMKFTVVGTMDRPNYIIEPYQAAGYTVITKIDGTKDYSDVSVAYVNSKEHNTYDKTILESTQATDTFVNAEYLRYQGIMGAGALSAILGIAAVVMVIIVVSSVFVIRNSFSISVSEKTRQYGMLSSIGATKKQIRNNVIYEGLIIGLIAIPLGILCGVLGIYVLLKVVNYLLGDILNGMMFVYSLPLIPVIISVILSFITIYLSCLLPAIKASKISAIEAIRGNNEVSIKAKKIKIPKYINKLFGIGGVIASKNLKRFKRKYLTTIISIVISIVIFVSLSSFIYYGNIVSGVYYTDVEYNIHINDSEDDINSFKKVIKECNIENYGYFYEGTAPLNVDTYCTDFGKEMYNLENKGRINIDGDVGNIPDERISRLNLIIYNDDYFKEYLESLNIDAKNYTDGGILIDEVLVNTTEGNKELKRIYNIKKGDTIINSETKTVSGNNLKVLAVSTQKPMGREDTYMDGGMFITCESYVKLTDETYLDGLYINADDADAMENSINDLIETDDTLNTLSVTNLNKMVQAQSRMILVISIFLYGFITVITLIGVTNIFNTISTNMILRSKEFAMLKSIGMTNKEFNKMITLESIMYGAKSLILGLPIGILGSYAMYKSFAESIDCGYTLPLKAIILSIIFVFIIVGLTMRYSLSKINKQNIIDTIRNDNI